MNERIAVFAGPASETLGGEICELLGTAPGAYECRRFPDGEVQMALEQTVRGCDVFLVQSTSPPVEQHLIELLLLADACRRAGARRLTAVIPYFGYARQDRRTERRSLGARVIADVIATARFDRLLLVDAHTASIEAFFAVPIDHLTAIPLLAEAVAPSVRANSIVVAPDLGAVKRAREYARRLQLPMAVVHKSRLDGETVEAHGVIGTVQGRHPIIVDDMLSTGATIEAAWRALHAAGATEPVIVVVTHALYAGQAGDVLGRLPLARVIAGNTVARDVPKPPLELISVASLLATAISRDHQDQSLADLRVTT
jgi:ribose-phosphate pyrophosphokinase